MEYFVSEGQFSENLIKATPPHNGADLAASFKVAKECMRKGDAYSSDCRLSISRLLTQQAKLMYADDHSFLQRAISLFVF
jgi:hypothetical protein